MKQGFANPIVNFFGGENLERMSKESVSKCSSSLSHPIKSNLEECHMNYCEHEWKPALNREPDLRDRLRQWLKGEKKTKQWCKKEREMCYVNSEKGEVIYPW